MHQGGGRPGGAFRGGAQATPAISLSRHYLKDGYFDAHGHLRPDLLTTKERPSLNMDQGAATDLDRALHALKFGPIRNAYNESGIKTAQLRKFYNQAKQLESRLRGGQAIGDVTAGLLRLEESAAYAVGREVACEALVDFMRLNIREARRSEKHVMQGFIPHFEAVVAYTTYYWGDKEGRR